MDNWFASADPWPEVRRQFVGEPHHEADGIGLLYAHRREAPAVARAWLAGEWIDCYADDLRRAGDPRALRPVALDLSRGPTADDLGAATGCDVPTLLEMVGPGVAARLARLLAEGLAVDWGAEEAAASRKLIGDAARPTVAERLAARHARPLAIAWHRCRRAGVAWGAACGFAKKR